MSAARPPEGARSGAAGEGRPVHISAAAGSSPRPPLAGGLPISEVVADQAAAWLTLLMSDDACDADRQRWQQWRAAHPDHERAWQHIEAVTGRLKRMQPQAAYQTLSPYAGAPSAGRRKAVRALLWGGVVVGGAALLASRTQTWQQMAADFHTDTGEQRTITLDDGSAITLNTATAIKVRFDGRQRLLRLLRCAPEVADLRVSGVFPLQNTDNILSSLPSVLPVQVRLRTRYWVSVEAAKVALPVRACV